jgi:hypothetical protein
LVANHLITSTFSLVERLLDNGMSHTPEQMRENSAQLIMLPNRHLLVGNEYVAKNDEGWLI